MDWLYIHQSCLHSSHGLIRTYLLGFAALRDLARLSETSPISGRMDEQLRAPKAPVMHADRSCCGPSPMVLKQEANERGYK